MESNAGLIAPLVVSVLSGALLGRLLAARVIGTALLLGAGLVVLVSVLRLCAGAPDTLLSGSSWRLAAALEAGRFPIVAAFAVGLVVGMSRRKR